MVSERSQVRHARCNNRSLNPCFSGRWFRSGVKRSQPTLQSTVLILVLVEDGFGANIGITWCFTWAVLILVLVEDGFGGKYFEKESHTILNSVLILVLVEDGFGAI